MLPFLLLACTPAEIVPEENWLSKYWTNCPPVNQFPSITIPVSEPDGQLSTMMLDVGVPHPPQPAMLIVWRRILTFECAPSIEIPSL